MKYYTTERIDRKGAVYNVIFGERSNGKTYALLLKCLKEYWETGKQMAYVRRWKEDITGRRAARLYSGIIDNDEVSKVTKGAFTGIHYWAGKWYLCNYDDGGKPIYREQDIISFSFSLSDGEHDKSTSFPNIGTIVFDEFLTNRLYLNDEFVLFMNTVSTIVRRRTGVKIYMLGNTVNRYCPYFQEMGLTNVLEMKQGTIDFYRYGDSELTVAVEYCKASKPSEEADKYFAFNNPKLSMITDGAWELSLYPHLPYKYKPKDVLLVFYIDFDGQLYQGNVIEVNNTMFIYIHDKTTPINDPENSLIYSLEPKPELNYARSPMHPTNLVQKRISWFFANDRVYYQNNSIGDSINNFLKVTTGKWKFRR